MNIDINDIDIERLRKELIDYFTSAMFFASPIALVDLTEVENANDEELIIIAINNGFNLKNFIKSKGLI